MMRTATNVTGDLVCCAYVGKSEDEMEVPTDEDLARLPE
jgi:Na+/H+-dicarboxylate symporter